MGFSDGTFAGTFKASITFSSLFHEIQLSQSNHLHSFHTFFLQVSGKFVSPFSS